MKSSATQMKAYSEAATSGLYDKQSGLAGKYDNVRRLWEDEVTRGFLYPHLHKLLDRTQKKLRRLRVLDLGCGSADGYELLAGVRQRDADLNQSEVYLINDERLGHYKGIDLNGDLLEQARRHYGNQPKMTFQQGDFSNGLPLDADEKPYDLYFTSYGTFSHHLDDATAVHLLADIARHVDGYGLIICDWLGRYSYEWQELWVNDPAEMTSMDYVVSYIYPPEVRRRRRKSLQHLTLRLMGRGEVESVVSRASEAAGIKIRPLGLFDRSVLTGRHMDTAEYNRHAPPLRAAVNSLHEHNVRTQLSSLIFNYAPKQGFDLLNNYFEQLQYCWNTLVRYTDELLENYCIESQKFNDRLPSLPTYYPPLLREMAERMKRVVAGAGWMGYGLPRENIIEPQLGYSLRHLVSRMQQGNGCAHGLIGIFEIDKEASAD